MVTGDEVRTESGVSLRDNMPPSGYDGKLEDERCAMYVMVTRAQERLFLSGSARNGNKLELRPSRFLGEMGFELGMLDTEYDPDDEYDIDLAEHDRSMKVGTVVLPDYDRSG